MNPAKPSGWKKILFKASITAIILFIANLFVVYLMGPTIWLYAGYFLGNSLQATLSVLLFVEGIIILSLGAVWISGAMETRFDGSNIMTNPYRRQEQFKQRSEMLEQENTSGKVMILTGAPILIVSIILVFV